MSKFIADPVKVVVNSVNLSDHGFGVTVGMEKERIDVSGFSVTGTREYLPGQEEQTITVRFLNDMSNGSVFQTLRALYESGSAFPFYVQPLGLTTAGTSDANPLCGGSAILYSLPAEFTLNERAEIEVEFRPAPGSRFTWGTVAP